MNKRLFFSSFFLSEIEQKINRDDLIYKIGNTKKHQKYDFQKFKTIRYFGREIDNGNLTLDCARENQMNLNMILINLKNLQNRKSNKKRIEITNF